MAHESFEDPETAALMNELFVNIKVDREERPDIDHLYMSALHALGEQGGWPMTMFIAPDGPSPSGAAPISRPSRAGAGRPSARCCRASPPPSARTTTWSCRTPSRCAGALARMAAANPGELPGPALWCRSRVGLLRPPTRRGWAAGRPEIPQPADLPLPRGRCGTAWPSRGLAAVVHLLLRRMSPGRHLRPSRRRLCPLFSTDAIWLVPHFEKMLYDNAQMLELLALAHAQARPTVSPNAPRKPSAGCCAT